ncbi:MAG: hypothetical protein ACQESG_02995 [Nanobdellota archaeon]
MFGFFRKEYSVVLDGQRVSVLHLKHMDKMEKDIDRNTAQLHRMSVQDATRYIVEFTKINGKKVYFDLPERYAQLL